MCNPEAHPSPPLITSGTPAAQGSGYLRCQVASGIGWLGLGLLLDHEARRVEAVLHRWRPTGWRD